MHNRRHYTNGGALWKTGSPYWPQMGCSAWLAGNACCCSLNGPFCQCRKNSPTECMVGPLQWNVIEVNGSKNRRSWWWCNTGGGKDQRVKVEDEQWEFLFHLNSATRKQESFLCTDLNSKSSQRADRRSFNLAWGTTGKAEAFKSETENIVHTTTTQKFCCYTFAKTKAV